MKNHKLPYWIPSGKCSGSERAYAALYLFTGLSLAFIYASGQTLIRMPTCPLREYTGLYCAGCGSVRATLALTSGDLVGAWLYNPLAVLFFPLLLWAAISYGSKVFCGRTMPTLYIPSSWILIFVVFIVVYTVLRNLPFPGFAVKWP